MYLFVVSFFILFIILFGLTYSLYGNKNNLEEEDKGKRLFFSTMVSIFVSVMVIGMVYGYSQYRQNVKVYLDEDYY